MSGKKNREQVSWRLKEPHYQTFNDWCNAQDNVQESLTNIVLHLIERFGNRNIRDFDIQKALYQDLLSKNQTEDEISEKNFDNEEEEKLPQEISSDKEQGTEDLEVQEDDIYKELDPDNL
jgi:hypothetical protein